LSTCGYRDIISMHLSFILQSAIFFLRSIMNGPCVRKKMIEQAYKYLLTNYKFSVALDAGCIYIYI
jgi:hypothetical protein